MTLQKVCQFVRRYPLTITSIALTWYLCLFKPPHTRLDKIEYFDKFVHVSMYLGICSLMWIEYLRSHVKLSWRRIVVWVILAPIAMSGLIELAQAYLTTTRNGDWLDFLANSIGVLIAAGLGQTVYRRYIHSQPSRK